MKITLSRIFETSKALATAPGQELQEFITFVADMSEQVLRALRNGLTFEDNIRCLTPKVSVTAGVDQVINTNGRVPTRVLLSRVYSTIHASNSFLWYINSQNQLVVRIGFTGTPSGQLDVELLIFYS